VRAAVLSDAGLSVREWPEPEPAPGEALVSLSKVGICGSDVHFVLDGSAKPAFLPIVLGHEPCGRVEALGPGTAGPEPGTRVAIIPLLHCGACSRCLAGRTVICRESQCIGAERHGCWADLAVVPVENLVEVPEGLSDELAAVATDSVATAYHAVAARGGLRPGARVAIWGVGGLGLSAVGIAKALGAASVIAVDPRPEARAWALETGADEAIEPDGAVKRIAAGGGVDVALEFVGRQATMDGAVRCLDDGGRAVIVGIGAEPAAAGRQMSLVVRERDVVGSYGAEPDEVRTVVRMLAAGELRLPRVVGDVIPLEDVATGLERVARGDTGGSRIVLDVAGTR
jgi:threonine dehydrogenase-like Zn-dependent dehydrogenase